MDIHERFLEVFSELLDEVGINRGQFAERSGIPYYTIIGWTNKGRLPDFNALIKIADFFDCSIDYLTGRTSDYVESQNKKPNQDENKINSKFIDGRILSDDDFQLVQNLVQRLKKNY